jgi:hypothetical protein
MSADLGQQPRFADAGIAGYQRHLSMRIAC